jgi:hypothetical protein
VVAFKAQSAIGALSYDCAPADVFGIDRAGLQFPLFAAPPFAAAAHRQTVTLNERLNLEIPYATLRSGSSEHCFRGL